VSLKLLKEQKGFTLLELLIVIVIIGILALLIIPNITSAPKKARDTQRKTDLTTIRKGLEEYFVNNNAYPATLAALEDVNTGPIMKDVPDDPKNSGVLVYTFTNGTPTNGYTLKACLENAGDNGANVAADATCTAPAGGKAFTLTNAN
jgi:type II secretion system protein G